MAQDETASEDPEAKPPATETRDKGIFLPLIFGGAVAAALGFFGSQIDSVERALGLAPPENGLQEVVDAQATRLDEQATRIDEQTEEIEAQAERISAQAEEISALTEQVESLPEPPPPPDLSGIESQLSEQSQRIADLAQRVEEVEKRPMTESLSEEAIAAYQEELDRLQASVSDQRSEIEAMLDAELDRLQTALSDQRAEIEAMIEQARSTESAAERKARLADSRAAVARIVAAIDNGAPFAEELQQLQSADQVEVPQELVETAADGVSTLGALQSQFPQASRAALAAARAQSGEGGFGAFLERQLGARSVTPQEGDDPDAVLSRAEAAVMQGRLGEALTELDALPEVARDVMGNWILQAETRHGAVRAAQDLMSALGTN